MPSQFPSPNASRSGRPRKGGGFVLRCENDKFLLECGNVKTSQEFSTLLNALVFVSNSNHEGETPLTVLDAQGKLIDKSLVGRRTW